MKHVRYLVNKQSLLILLSMAGLLGCKKFVEVNPPVTDLVAATVYTSDTKATATMTSIYSDIVSGGFAPGESQSISIVTSLSSDEFVDYSLSSPRTEFYGNQISPSNGTNLVIWKNCYQYIYRCNAVIEGLSSSSGLTPAIKKQLQGEALFLRAFLYFYLVNLWGDVPYITTTNYQLNATAGRTAYLTVFEGMARDLEEAKNLMGENYTTPDRIRPSKWTAAALLARVYLFMKEWTKAETAATELINNTGKFSLVQDLNKVFVKGSTETIWQLMPVLPDYNSSEGHNYILIGTPYSVALSEQLVQAFETDDQRKSSWVTGVKDGGLTYYFPFKYKIKSAASLSEYNIVFRLSEQYLIRSEARAQLNKLMGADGSIADVNMIRTRAGLLPLSGLTQSQALGAIENERRVELFTEWGHRWLDLKRTNRATAVLGPLKQRWQPADTLYPIPVQEILNNRQLTQNSGY
jgi:hypothetical protein